MLHYWDRVLLTLKRNKFCAAHFGLLASFAIGVAACKPASSASSVREAVDPANDSEAKLGIPLVNFDAVYKPKVGNPKIPAEKTLSFKPWPSTYWPHYRGLTANRWQQNVTIAKTKKASDFLNYMYPLLTVAEMKSLKEDEIAKLSPAEKFDLVNDSFHLPLTKAQLSEASRQISKRTVAKFDGAGNRVEQKEDYIPKWFGLCQGWSAASVLTKTPKSVRVKNKAGQCVPFYTADIEALLSLAYSYDTFADPSLGDRCIVPAEKIEVDEDGRPLLASCRDMNPASFHVAVTKLINDDKLVVMDVSFADDVWNHPIYGYRIRYVSDKPGKTKNSAFGTEHLIEVEMAVTYMQEGEPEKDALEPNWFMNTETYFYTLELNESRNIIGGEWRYKKNQDVGMIRIPDYIWTATDHPGLNIPGVINYKRVAALLQASLVQKSSDECMEVGLDIDPAMETPFTVASEKFEFSDRNNVSLKAPEIPAGAGELAAKVMGANGKDVLVGVDSGTKPNSSGVVTNPQDIGLDMRASDPVQPDAGKKVANGKDVAIHNRTVPLSPDLKPTSAEANICKSLDSERQCNKKSGCIWLFIDSNCESLTHSPCSVFSTSTSCDQAGSRCAWHDDLLTCDNR